MIAAAPNLNQTLETLRESSLHELCVERDGLELTVLPIREGDEVTIGRGSDCTIALDDDLVSRRHAQIRLQGGEIRVEDTSTNGTLAGGVLLRRQAGQVALERPILIGRSRFTVRRSSRPPPEVAPTPAAVAESAPNELRREIHRLLLEHLDMNAIDPTRGDDPALRPRVLAALRRIVRMLEARLPAGLSQEALIGEMADEALGLGPLEHLLADPGVSEVMVIDAHNIYVERDGRLSLSGAHFTDEERVRAAIERIVTPLGRRVDESSPLVDARLKDGSRVNVVIRPLALRGSCITIRKFARTPITLDKLLELETLSEPMARFLTRSVRAKKNVVISGGTGSGKTTLLNVLSSAIPEDERIVTIEDAAELQLTQPHVVSLESRPSNMEGKGEVPIRALVKNALRMRPDRIVVGECRGGEALDMLQAMNTGHDGSLTTTHANSPAEALLRLETLCLMAGVALPQRVVREQIAKSIHLLVQQTRLSDGSRRVTAIAELAGLDRDGNLRLRPIFEFVRTGMGAGARVQGAFHATGYLPSFLPELMVQGLIKPGEAYLLIPHDALALIKLASIACATLAIVVAFGAVACAPDTLASRLYHRYVAALERKMRLLFIETRGAHIVAGQALAMAAMLALGLVLGLPLLFLTLPLIGAAPMLVLERKRKLRVQKIEQKLDGFVVALANALRATPSPGRALAMVHGVTPAPLDREIELVLREMRVGSTLEQALGNLSARVRSFQLDAALSGLLIGRQTGGNVPQILDGAAETLREMARLSGVLRAKTADGRAQANVLAVFPALLIFAFDWASPGYFRPLTDSASGIMVTLIALSMWLGAVVMIRRIMEAEL